MLSPASLLPSFLRPLQFQRQQPPRDRLVVRLGRVFRPTVCGPDGVVGGLVEPGGAGV